MLKNIIKYKIQILKKYIFYKKYKNKAINQQEFFILFKKNDQKFITFLNKLKNENFIPKLNFAIDKSIKIANEATQNRFYILNKKLSFDKNINWSNLDWSQDFSNFKYSFYQDIKLKTYTNNNINNLGPDIKIPWEFSRLYYFVDLAVAYKKTHDKKYIDVFVTHTKSWIESNPFLLGVNWLNPMEVAIRAINLIYAFNYFKNENISNNFWLKLINSLYQHKIYIQNNWEIFYKNNNHYITDLIGYFYLLIFFDLKREQNKILKKILEEFETQIMPDGTCYEGSTSYHKLTIELFLLFYYLCKKNNLSLPNKFKTKLNKSINFINDCTDFNNNFVQIGDNDSGKILHNFHFLHNKKYKNKLISHYKNFGLTIIKNNKIHITYRHPTYKKIQPTGHFHNDSLSITLSYNNIPIIIDPGTYVYTSNKFYRNKLRSFNNHNTFFIKDSTSEQDIFKLNKQVQKDTAIIKRYKNKIFIKNYYINDHIKLFRTLIFNKINNNLLIKDFAKNNTDKIVCWNFIFHPNIKIKRLNKNKFELLHENKTIFILKSNLDFSIQDAFYSQEYGVLEKCTKLKTLKKIKNQKIIIKLYAAKT
ncbi:heparinase II/III family protein [Candidatus Dependentiae bacterium]|nr:heparinase II/III family protein [Candidatus Dependentiae bacterium]